MNPYIQSLRLRTLPLSMSGIVLGSGLAASHFRFEILDLRFWIVFFLAILTTLSLQILSNLCNELGDALKGTDADQRNRAAYGLQAGTITVRQMKYMIELFIGLSIVFGTALVFTAFQFSISNLQSSITNILIFLGLGALAIVGAIKYTLGKHSYGYYGLGDLGVFLFFGLLSTLGAFYLQCQTLTLEALCCGIAIGLPCVGVLTVNNMRDMDNDRKHGKHTFASLLGQTGGRIYHTVLLVACLALFVVWGHYWVICIVPVWAWHLWFIWTQDASRFDRQMPVLMLSTLVVSALGWL
jgi:1,4-dihydroxy-2-naphthoate octaprenyltransferase